ncbi:hut operon transcriptional regulator HutP [Evansella halocellulosilytica]|uniref:hut operon transcriptional regulator HutP n=1 Tax=Evansella halocellulosilytica TaxID=2011013 RepID=UPI000BB952E6|nr:hut operon transcriptional regulator HutP [Evansella halocellulosilytica]
MFFIPDKRIGRTAMHLALTGERSPDGDYIKKLNEDNLIFCQGKAGSMEINKVVAAIETAAKKNDIIRCDIYRETHALYHATMEGLNGITRGQFQLGTVLRSVGLNFAVVRGNPYTNENEGEWIAVAFYGTIGAPIKGKEHEAIGLGINHI